MSVKRPYEEDVSDELQAKIKRVKESETVKKHSLDSDEDDSDEEQKSRYEILADDDIEAGVKSLFLHRVFCHIRTTDLNLVCSGHGLTALALDLDRNSPMAWENQIGSQEPPVITWNANKSSYYTLVFTDVDMPKGLDFRQYTHWLAVNIPGSDLPSASTAYSYIGSGPLQGSGLHRYVFILFKQKSKLDGSATADLKDEKFGERGIFSIPEFVSSNGLEAIALNYYRAQYDDSVPLLVAFMKQRYSDF